MTSSQEMMRCAALLATTLLAAGCTFCREHRAVCAAGTTIAVTSVALSMRHDRHEAEPRISTPLTPDCVKFPETCK